MAGLRQVSGCLGGQSQQVRATRLKRAFEVASMVVIAPTEPDATAAGEPQMVLPPGLRLTPDQFALVCQVNPDAVLELDAHGTLHSMTPTGGETGARSGELFFQLKRFARRGPQLWQAFDSSTGFQLPDGSVLSPDASLVRLERWQALTAEQRRGFPPLCPDLVVELASPSDQGPRGADALRRKMATYIANGAELGWLLFPEQQAAEIWRPGLDDPERLQPAQELLGGPGFEGLQLNLMEIWTV